MVYRLFTFLKPVLCSFAPRTPSCATAIPLKHACCRHLLNKGFNVEQVQDWVGHANIQNNILYSRATHSSREQMGKALAEWK